MSTLEDHDAEQAAITALCEAGQCDHPECQSETDDYENECVTRSAPRWAWDMIDETLSLDANSGAFSSELRAQIENAQNAMHLACETGADHVTEEMAEAHE